MPRSSNATQRRQVLRTMAAVKRSADRVRRTWDVTGLVYGQGGPDAAAWRPRAEGEYPENTKEAWSQVYNETDALIRTLEDLRATALERYKALHHGETLAVNYPHGDHTELARALEGR